MPARGSSAFGMRHTNIIPRSYTRDLENWCRQYEGILALVRTALVMIMLVWIVSK